MIRRMLVALVFLAVATHGRPSFAGCSAIPATDIAGAPPVFYGARGGLQSPFLIPSERLFVRRTCETGTPFPVAADVRVVVMLQPPNKKAHAIILKQGDDGPCATTDSFTAGCNRGLTGIGVATCLSIKDLNATDDNVDLKVPFLDPSATPIRATSGRVAVAVASQNQDGEKLCRTLSNAGDGCARAMDQVSALYACIDKFVLPGPPGSECMGTDPHPTFPGPTLLPLPNDARTVCGKEIGGDFCTVPDPKPVSETRYTLDGEGNILVPVTWEASLAVCKKGCRKLRIQADLVPPYPLDMPDNSVQYPSRNDWLRSYTLDGGRNDPEFAKLDFPAPGTRAFYGTSDEPKSVLRFERRLKMCGGSTNGCERPSECRSGIPCQERCPNDRSRTCSTGSPCPNNGSCGKVHDFFPAFRNGRWTLDRNPGGLNTPPALFCEDDSTKTCPATACATGVDCVSYRLTLGDCDCETVATEAAVSTPVPARIIAPLASALGLAPNDLVKSAASADGAWLAVIAPSKSVRETPGLPESCRSAAGARLLAIARSSECTPTSCIPVCPDVGAGELRDELAVVGSQVRFLQAPDVAAQPTSLTDRLAAWLQDLFGRSDAPAPEGSPLVSLRLVDGRYPTVVTTVPNVVTSRPAYNPMVVAPSGATRFLVQAGRCVSAGRVLGIPSLCHPERTGECPAWSSCEPDEVVIALDLSIDRDDDGIPDRLDPFVGPPVTSSIPSGG